MKKEDLTLKDDLIVNLPILPQSFRKLVKLHQVNEFDCKKLKPLIFEDVCLCIKALSEINAIEDKKQPFGSFDQALESLDLEHLLIKSLSSPLYQWNSEETVWLKQFNQRSFVTGLTCRLIGEEKGYPDLEELYLCGLLHDSGILFLKTSFPEEYKLVLEKKNNGERLSTIEKEFLATNHLEFGEETIINWSFPKNLKKVIESHEIDLHENSESSEQACRIVSVAERISEILFVEAERKAMDDLFRSWENCLDLPAGFFDRIYSRLSEEVKARALQNHEMPEDLTETLLQGHSIMSGLYHSCEEKTRERFRCLTRKNEEERKKAELESLKVILATFSHYINNATTSIMGRSQLIDIAIKKGEIKDESGKIANSMRIIQQGVENITAVLNGLKRLDSFKTVRYHERSNIIDLRDKIEIRGL
ncbi:MAG TPA: HDOD domain-containing protein [Terriglobales bacterium]|nr:HDOD domain-containing protein [Terriglobales bacterium]